MGCIKTHETRIMVKSGIEGCIGVQVKENLGESVNHFARNSV